MTDYEAHGIGWAVEMMRANKTVRRRGWNGKDQWIALQLPQQYSKMTQPYVYMKTTDSTLVPWLCSQSDLLAMDWEIA